jgi:hypothetical protein
VDKTHFLHQIKHFAHWRILDQQDCDEVGGSQDSPGHSLLDERAGIGRRPQDTQHLRPRCHEIDLLQRSGDYESQKLVADAVAQLGGLDILLNLLCIKAGGSKPVFQDFLRRSARAVPFRSVALDWSSFLCDRKTVSALYWRDTKCTW